MVNQQEVERRLEALEPRLASVRQRMAGAGGSDVALLAVTKGHPVEAAVAATLSGLDELGENYAQELASKADHVTATWHFIGQLQSNKVRLVANHVNVWQSVDRLKVGREIAKRAPGATVFAQANLSGDPTKAGCELGQLDELIDELAALDIIVGGVMGVGSADDVTTTAAGFRALRKAADRHGLAHCSMGMSADLEVAIREGSTMVRIGSDLFGPRQ